MKSTHKNKELSIILCFALLFGVFAGTTFAGTAQAADNEMYVGAGIGDITGPITEISTGYNSLGDVLEGLLMRLYARAFIIKSGDSSIVYVSAEMVHMTESIKPGVLKELKARGLGDVYTEENVMLAATHCHSSPSNVSWYPLYDLINGVPGYDDLYYKIVVQGIADAIENAHESLQPGTVKIASGDVENAVYNRSKDAYNANHNADDYDTDINEEMILLRFEGADGSPIGSLNWFGSHGTSNSIDNTYASADHKGYAAYEFEQDMGDGFVAAFSQSECGDSSPNQPQEDYHDNFLRPSDLDDSLDVIENEIVHGTKELNAAETLFDSATTELSAGVDYRYANVEFSDISVDPAYIGDDCMPYDDIDNATTSEPCIGAGIMAGDEEGAPVDYAEEGQVRNTYTQNEDGTWTKNEFDFSTLDLSGLQYLMGPLWPTAMKVLQSDEYDEVQAEKVVCLAVGDLVQTIQPLQIFTVGELAIVGVPFELTTMQARRTKEALMETLAPAGITQIVLSTLTNSYSQYITTREEYTMQNYEGATNLYGPWSGAALTQELDKLCQALASGETVDHGPVAPDKSAQVTVRTPASAFGVVRDAGSFGKVITDVETEYTEGDTVTVVMQGASPRNVVQLRADGKLGKYYSDPDNYSYMEVQKLENGKWTTVRDDADPYTTFSWERTTGSLSAYSQVTLGWLLRDAEPGTYRLVYNGIAKNLFGIYTKFTGVSGQFKVVE
ncbi:MAG: alkaline ceramidase [Clostridia bacterium]|nr:alkaline ceramidase [Clostridia bacterium]